MSKKPYANYSQIQDCMERFEPGCFSTATRQQNGETFLCEAWEDEAVGVWFWVVRDDESGNHTALSAAEALNLGLLI